MKAVVVDPTALARLALKEVAEPVPNPAEALVRVAAISLNLGEVRRAQTVEAGWQPGWDLAGTVEQAAVNGSGPGAGTRVVGFVPEKAWGELVAVPTNSLAQLPANVSFAQAATLPVAGLTALYALERGGFLLGRKVLVTGASGGVGIFACQLAHLSGAYVVAGVRQADKAASCKEAGADEVVVGEDLSMAKPFGRYDLILESVGGSSLGTALSLLAPGGVCVSFGASAGGEVTFDVRSFFPTGGASLYGFILFNEVGAKPASQGLDRLARLISDGRLQPLIDLEAPLSQIGEVAQKLLDRQITGKAVLHLN